MATQLDLTPPVPLDQPTSAPTAAGVAPRPCCDLIAMATHGHRGLAS